MKNIYSTFLFLAFLGSSLLLNAQNVKLFGSEHKDDARNMFSSSQGDYVVYGKLGNGQKRPFIFRMNKSLDVTNQKFYIDSQTGMEFYGITELPDGSLLAVGYRDKSSILRSMIVVKLDANLNLLWSKEYENSEDNILYKTIALPNGDFVGIGKNATNNGYSSFWQFTITRFSSDGNIIWSIACGEPGPTPSDWTSDLLIDSNGDLLVSGTTYSLGNGGNNHDPYFMWIDLSNGDIKSHRGFANLDNSSSTFIRQLPNGEYLVGGSVVNSSINLYIAKLRNDFSIKYQRSYDFNNLKNSIGSPTIIGNSLFATTYIGSDEYTFMEFDLLNGDLVNNTDLNGSFLPVFTTNGTDVVFGGSTDQYTLNGLGNDLLFTKFPLSGAEAYCVNIDNTPLEVAADLGPSFSLSSWIKTTPVFNINTLNITSSDYNFECQSVCGNTCNTVGIQPNITSDIKVYPTLVSRNLTIDLSQYQQNVEQISLFDMNGRSVMRTSDRGIVSMNLSALASGVYFLKVDAFVWKVIKQ